MTAQRSPPVYSGNRSYVTVTASFKASGVDVTTSADKARVSWSQSNAIGGTFTLTPSTDGKSCNVSAQQQTASQVDITCSYLNSVDLEEITEAVTIFFYTATAVDDISLVCS